MNGGGINHSDILVVNRSIPPAHEVVVATLNGEGVVKRLTRSQESKKLGIAMGIPLFQIKDLCHHYHVEICFSNYQWFPLAPHWVDCQSVN